MARKTTTPPAPKTYTLTQEQLSTLRDLAHDFMNIRSKLEDLEGEDDLSKIMFQVGVTFSVASQAETVIDELVDSFDEDCDDCDNDLF